jgi:glycosyltransferase involved in cell wall biosynthesis
MIIGFDAKRAFCTVAGLGQYSRNHLRMMVAMGHAHSFVLFTPEIRLKDFEEEMKAYPNITIVTNTSFLPHWFWRQYKVASLAQTFKVEVFHGLSNEIPHGLRIPSVVTLHDLIPFTDEAFTPIYQLWAYRRKMTFAVKQAQHIVSVSHFTHHALAKRFPFALEKATVLPPVFLPQKPMAPKASLPLPFEDKPFLLYLGTLGPRKNLGNLLEAILHLRKKGQIVRMVLAGKSVWFSDSLKEFVRNMQLEEQVIFTGEVSEEEKMTLLSAATGLVYPSLIEGFGLPVLEALCHGKPVAVSAHSAMEEAAGNLALTFDPRNVEALADCLEQLYLFPSPPHPEAWHNHIQSFAPEHLFPQWDRLYRKLKN